MAEQLALAAVNPSGIGSDLGLVTRGDSRSWATFSPDGRYRYALARFWDDPDTMSAPLFVACLINPSVADHAKPDPTMTRLVGFARREGCGGLLIVNAFALVATDPKELAREAKRGGDPIGPHNYEVIRRAALFAPLSVYIVGWGIVPKRLAEGPRRAWLALTSSSNAMPPVRCFGTNTDGSPRHPLYLPGEMPLVPWRPRG